MQDATDIALLREYVRQNSDEAFATLVARHVNMVYSAALRKTGNPAAAEEITQAVFVILARKADELRETIIVSGWLYQAARWTAANFLRTEIRRARREQEACMQSLSNQTEPEIWPQIMPLLEDAMGRLGEKDRNALALRFFEGKSFQEIGAAFGASENAAKKRVAHALEKLRKFFAKRGVTSTTATIAETISANSVQAAPVALAKTATAVALVKGATASISTLTLIKGALKIMAWTKAKMAILVGAGVLLAAGAGTVAVEATHHPDIQGAWEGTLVSGTQKERLVFKITKENGSYRATGDYIDFGIKDAPFSKFSYNRPALHFEGNNAQRAFNMFVYDATLDSDMSELSGTWQQRGVSGSLILKRTAQPDVVPDKLKESDYTPRSGSDLQGFWAGTFDVGTSSWLLYFKIAEQPDGTFRAEADSINTNVQKLVLLSQGWENIPASSITYKQPSVELTFSGVGDTFQGDVNSDHSEIIGTWTLGSITIPLTMKRADPSSEDSRVAPPVGIGAALDLDKQTGMIRITKILPDTPAAQAGLSAGSVIQKVDDVSLAGKSLDECVGLIHGVAGTKVRLEIITSDKTATNTVELVRQRIQL